ncbi:MAG: tRNA preQ1(34) S-adenosylmethionine ribosyltransferase-isomerase QueA [Clostridiaceae bacterium]|jgi:S-adenosylmethionine:tRNA ribosyltransferase-isomerase|nr:tRNA preQ1(34) S-adenosylmethionine ribosyltransferase-isomerase QueA [Clostridiaceae bacterium]
MSTQADNLTSSYVYDLPQSLIAHHPADVRDQSRLLVMHGDGCLEHKVFTDLKTYLRPGDCLVLNDTRVIPARLMGKRAQTGGAVEFLLLRCLYEKTWRVLVKPGRNARIGEHVVFGTGELEAVVDDIESDGSRIVTFSCQGDLLDRVEQLGEMPLPPYIHENLDDPSRYQTVYANNPGSAAAPTAGLHFTDSLLKEIEAMGVAIARLTLHVGLGTFRPVKELIITDHVMHCESFILDEDAVNTITMTKAAGGRVIAVGTTSCRVLESVALSQIDREGQHGSPIRLRPTSGETELFISPGFTFRVVDAMITNFHLPGSTLLMLVSALMGRDQMLKAYHVAVEDSYRFFSFGDAMLLLPHDAQYRENLHTQSNIDGRG